MGDRAFRDSISEIVEEAARIICEEAVTDYRLAKRKAAERLKLAFNAPMPENARIQKAVIDYQRLYGGSEYLVWLRQMREAALRTMRLLLEFEPRLVGGVVSGAVSKGHRVQLHAFIDKAEMLDVFLQARGIRYQEGEREYRYSDGTGLRVPMCSFDAGARAPVVGVDVAIFPLDAQRRPPLSPTDGQPMKRLNLAQASELLASDQSPDRGADQRPDQPSSQRFSIGE